jgi:hypothetical protein
MLKIVKDSVLRVSRSFGYDIVPLREMKERDFALHLRELLTRLDIDCVLDVGANAGQYRDFLRDKVLYDATSMRCANAAGAIATGISKAMRWAAATGRCRST